MENQKITPAEHRSHSISEATRWAIIGTGAAQAIIAALVFAFTAWLGWHKLGADEEKRKADEKKEEEKKEEKKKKEKEDRKHAREQRDQLAALSKRLVDLEEQQAEKERAQEEKKRAEEEEKKVEREKEKGKMLLIGSIKWRRPPWASGWTR